MNFNEKLISLRKSMGLSQEELGAELHVSRQTISKWESAQSYPDFQRLVLLSDYFGLTLDELVRDVDVADVRSRNLNSEKLDSLYNDVGIAKKFIKWYLILAGGAGHPRPCRHAVLRHPRRLRLVNPDRQKAGPLRVRLSVSQKRHAPGGTHFCAQSRDRNSSWLRCPVFAAPVAAGLQKADRGPCSASAVSAAGSASASQSLVSPWGQNFAQNRALGPNGLAHSLRSISLYVSRPYAHVVRPGLF